MALALASTVELPAEEDAFADFVSGVALASERKFGDAHVRLWGTHENDGERWHGFDDGTVSASSSNLARAWLLAILHALSVEG